MRKLIRKAAQRLLVFSLAVAAMILFGLLHTSVTVYANPVFVHDQVELVDAIQTEPEGTTIRVVGTIHIYHTLVVNRSVNICGLGGGELVICPINGLHDVGGGQHPCIVRVAAPAQNVTISNIRVAGPAISTVGGGRPANRHPSGIRADGIGGTGLVRLDNVLIENMFMSGGPDGIPYGSGVWNVFSNMEIVNSEIRNFNRNGVINWGGDLLVGNTDIIGRGPQPATAAQNGIQTSDGGTTSLNGSTISGFTHADGGWISSGILMEAGTLTANGNVISNSDVGVALSNTGSNVTLTNTDFTGNIDYDIRLNGGTVINNDPIPAERVRFLTSGTYNGVTIPAGTIQDFLDNLEAGALPANARVIRFMPPTGGTLNGGTTPITLWASNTGGNITPPVAVLNGLTLLSWTNQLTGDSYTPSPDFNVAGPMIVYPFGLVVTFDSDGGSAVTDIVNVAYGATIVAPQPPTKSGYEFKGWYTTSAHTTAWNFGTGTVTANMTLYARWSALPTYTVTFVSNGGSAVAPITGVLGGSTITAPANPTRAGHTFVAWYTESAFTTRWVFGAAGTAVTDDVTLYARWFVAGAQPPVPPPATATPAPQATPQPPAAPPAADDTLPSVVLTWDAPGDTVLSDIGTVVETTVADDGTVTVIIAPSAGVELTASTNIVAPEGYVVTSITLDANGLLVIELTPVARFAYMHHAFMAGFEDGTVRPTGTISRAQAVTIIFRLMEPQARAAYWAQSNPFNDVNISAWYNNSVSTIANTGWLANIADGNTFIPNDAITRAEFIALMARLMEVEAGSGEAMFTDTSGHWAEGYINALAEQGKLQGPTGLGGPFMPNQTITRAEAAAIVVRLLERFPAGGVEGLLPGMNTWPDNANQNAWYFIYVQVASNSFYYDRAENAYVVVLVELFEPWQWSRLQLPDSRPEDLFRQ